MRLSVDTPQLNNVQIGASQVEDSNPMVQHFITTTDDVQVSSDVTSITIPSNSFNDANTTSYTVKGLDTLQSIVIGDDCFQNVITVVFEDLPSLTSISIGSNSFTKHKGSFGYDSSRKFSILNCPSLLSFYVDRFSFSDFSSFNLTSIICLFFQVDVLSLKNLTFGSTNGTSNNFYYSDLLIDGIFVVLL